MTDDSKVNSAVGCLVMLALMPVSWSLRGLVLTKLWLWFMVPTFGLRPLSVGAALGLSCIVSYLAYQNSDCVQEERTMGETVGRAIVGALAGPLITLFFGWLITQFWTI